MPFFSRRQAHNWAANLFAAAGVRYLRLFSLRGCALKGGCDRIVNPFEPDELQFIAGAERNLVEVTAIPRGQHDPSQARGGRRDNLFLDAADRKYQASQRN